MAAMKPQIFRPLSAIVCACALLLPVPPASATCGGGGGGGMGGGGGTSEPVYKVPWKVLKAGDTLPTDGLVVYWFPRNQQELDKSSLRNSRTLSLYSEQCVSLEVADQRSVVGQKLVPDQSLPVVVLATPDNSVIGKAENKEGFLKVEQVENLLDTEMKKREAALKERLDSGKNKAKSGDKQGAIDELRPIVSQKCMFPRQAKDASKELKKLGVTDVGRIFDAPNFDRGFSARIERRIMDGLVAEEAARYTDAERLYTEAHRLDVADPVPLRFLGELYRHHIGDWERARSTFNEILAMPADPLSRAVALHGLGKMTIHDGEFQKGLELMERSVQTFPLALAERNLAVYWNSEGNAEKTDYHVRQALALEPHDPYNLVFAAVFQAASGHQQEALKIARENQALLPASYNLAAIYAQAGEREKALELLKRHFYEYERYQSVRSKEMMEARVDAVFASIKADPAFVTLTSGADGKLEPARAMSERH
jgi:tetratricopeptide (TPR) repeat protein